MAQTWTRYTALGDSITEGWRDPVIGMGEPWFGWADRLALALDADKQAAGGARLEFANLAVRGRRVRHVVEEQIPHAISLRADLVSVLIGSNDLPAFRSDPDELAARLDEGVAALRNSGATVLLATVFDPGRALPLRAVRSRAALFNAHLATVAERNDAILLDLWGLPELRDRSGWADDRVHPSTRGHLAIARAAARRLGATAVPEQPTAELPQVAHLSNRVWARRHLLPWLGRRVRRVSTGDGRGPKLPSPRPVSGSTPRQH